MSERIARNTGLTDYYLGSAQNALDCKPCENLKIYNTDEYNQVRLFVTGELELDWDDCVNNRLTSLDVAENYFDDEEMKNIDLLEWAEEKFNCAGFCEENNFYMFSDIDTDNSPDNVCRDELKDWVEDYFIVFGVVLLFVGLLLLLVPICTAKVWCTCFRGKVGTGEIES